MRETQPPASANEEQSVSTQSDVTLSQVLEEAEDEPMSGPAAAAHSRHEQVTLQRFSEHKRAADQPVSQSANHNGATKRVCAPRTRPRAGGSGSGQVSGLSVIDLCGSVEKSSFNARGFIKLSGLPKTAVRSMTDHHVLECVSRDAHGLFNAIELDPVDGRPVPVDGDGTRKFISNNIIGWKMPKMYDDAMAPIQQEVSQWLNEEGIFEEEVEVAGWSILTNAVPEGGKGTTQPVHADRDARDRDAPDFALLALKEAFQVYAFPHSHFAVGQLAALMEQNPSTVGQKVQDLISDHHAELVTVRPGEVFIGKGHVLHAGAEGEPGVPAVRIHLDLRVKGREHKAERDTTYPLGRLTSLCGWPACPEFERKFQLPY
jgi:hypothetical protein